MQMVKKVLIGFLFVWITLLAFMPKEALYFKLEQTLEKQGIKINETNIKEGFFGLDISHATLYTEGIKVMTIEKIHLFTLLFYTTINVKGVAIDKGLQHLFPKYIQNIEVIHTVIAPLEVMIHAAGSFGRAEGKVSLSERKVHVDIIEAKEIQMIQSHLKRGKKGWYYEASF